MSETIAGWNPKHLEIALSLPADSRKLSAQRYIELHSTSDELVIDWQTIARLRQAPALDVEVALLEKAYSDCLEEYWFAYRDWLVETAPCPDQIDTIIFAGGTCQLLKPKLEEYFERTAEKFWIVHALEVVNALGITESYSSASRSFFSKNYHIRYADVVKLLLVLSGYQPQGEILLG